MSETALTSKTQARAWVRQFVLNLQRPCLVLLDGEMGAGKTQLVRWILEELKAGDVASPTFAIHHEYSTPSGVVDHVDLYRVESDADLEATGFWDLFQRPEGLIFIEWASRLPDEAYPAGWRKVHVHIRKSGVGEEGRVFKVDEP